MGLEEVSRISKNTAVLVVAKVISSGLVFLLAILINRRLGPELAGIYTYAFVLYTIFQVIPDFGIGNISVRDVSRNLGRMHFYFSNIVSLRYLLSMGALALLMLTNVATWLLQRGDPLAGEKFWAVFALSFCLLLEQPLSNSLAENFIAMQRLEVIAMVYLMMGAIRVAFSSWFILRGTGPTLVLLMLVYIASVLYTIAHFYWLYQRWRRREAARLAREEGEEVVAPATGDQAVSPALEAAEVALMETPDDMGVAALSKLEEPEGSPERPEDISDGRDLQRYLMRSAWPLALAAVGITVYAGLDVPLLSWIKGDWDVGHVQLRGHVRQGLRLPHPGGEHGPAAGPLQAGERAPRAAGRGVGAPDPLYPGPGAAHDRAGPDTGAAHAHPAAARLPCGLAGGVAVHGRHDLHFHGRGEFPFLRGHRSPEGHLPHHLHRAATADSYQPGADLPLGLHGRGHRRGAERERSIRHVLLGPAPGNWATPSGWSVSSPCRSSPWAPSMPSPWDWRRCWSPGKSSPTSS